MEHLSPAARSLWAKKSRTNELAWLPLAEHLADTAAVAEKLWDLWLPPGIKELLAAGMGREPARQLLVFAAAAHDLGKAIPAFQAKPAYPACPALDQRLAEKLRGAGLPLPSYRHFSAAAKTPHALAGHILLCQAGCGLGAAVILGAHHGKPPARGWNRRGPKTYAENYYLDKSAKEAWETVQQDLIAFALRRAGFAALSELPQPDLTAQVLLSGLVIMADWIASNSAYFPYTFLDERPRPFDPAARVEAAWEALDLPSGWKAAFDGRDLYSKRFSFLSAPNRLQIAVQEAAKEIKKPGIMVVEAPMGSGKTEAALVGAEIFAAKARRRGIFFALPTQATSDAIFPRMKEWLQGLPNEDALFLRLIHGKAEFNQQYQELKIFREGSAENGQESSQNGQERVEDDSWVIVHQWFEGRKKSMLDDFAAGTIDQLLLAALQQKHVMLRHLGLANKVVVIDECHAYDAYMSQYLGQALRWLGAYQVPVIVLSATLPAGKRQEVIDAYLGPASTPQTLTEPLAGSSPLPSPAPEWSKSRDYPLLTYTDGAEVKSRVVAADDRRIEVRMEAIDDAEISGRLQELLSEGGCAGVIVNTVRRAQELADSLRACFGEEKVRLLHARFLPQDRAGKESELLDELGKKPGTSRPPLRIVVGTQVLEQSLDIDFDLLITDLCPMDLLLQRLGRLFRHSRPRPGKLSAPLCLLLGARGGEFEAGSRKIYGAYWLMRTQALLPASIVLPDDIPVLVQQVYDDSLDLGRQDLAYIEARQEADKRIAGQKRRADTFLISPPWPEADLVGWLDGNVSEKGGEASVRDSDASIEVLLVQKKEGNFYFLPWLKDYGGRSLPGNEAPSPNLAKALAGCSLRLPGVLCHRQVIDQTIHTLEGLNQDLLAWQESPWLKGALFLVLDAAGQAELGGYVLSYDQEYGLRYRRKED